MAFTNEEKDRAIEILFYIYFDNKTEEMLGKKEFWEVIHSICRMYSIDNMAITKAVRMLLCEENAPQEAESYYLLRNMGLTVRPINKLTGIYWQKQKAIEEQLLKTPIKIHSRIKDVIIKRSMRDFLNALLDISETLSIIGSDNLKTVL